MKQLVLLLAICTVAIIAGCSLATSQTPTATLTWTAPTTYTDGTLIPPGTLTFNLYQGPGPGMESGPAARGISSPYTVTSGIEANTETCWQVTAVSAAGVESAKSNEACKSFVVASSYAPAPPTNLSTQ